MASGKTLELIALTRSFKWYPAKPFEQKPRDRSLPGKKRIRARKAAQRSA